VEGEEGEEMVLERGEGPDDDEYEQAAPPVSADDHCDWGLVDIGYGRRIHGSVEDTKLSTNKQHSLSHAKLDDTCLSYLSRLFQVGVPPPLFLSVSTLRARLEFAKI
jgi:hypothetical protein